MNTTTVALMLVLGVLVVAAFARRVVAIAASLAAFVAFNYFFLAPVGTLTIAASDDVAALFVLLGVSLIGSHLSQQARQRAERLVSAERERAEAEVARRSAHAKSMLVASLSHDVKTPLTALAVAASNLSSPDVSEADRREQLHIVSSELTKLRTLTEDLLELASVEAGAREAEREWVPARELVEAERRQARTPLGPRIFNVRDQTEGLVVQLDPRLTSAALAHVLENAAAWAPASTSVDLTLACVDSCLRITVRDHGPGLPAGEEHRVFERFYSRADAGTPFRRGLGLAVAKALVTVQGGRIAAATHPSGGAEVTLDVPTRVRAEAETAEEPA